MGNPRVSDGHGVSEYVVDICDDLWKNGCPWFVPSSALPEISFQNDVTGMKFMDSLGTAARRVVVIDDNVAANGAQCVRQSLFTRSLQFTDDIVLGRRSPQVSSPSRKR